MPVQLVSLHIKFHVIWTNACEAMPKNSKKYSIILYGGIGQWGIHLLNYHTKFTEFNTATEFLNYKCLFLRS